MREYRCPALSRPARDRGGLRPSQHPCRLQSASLRSYDGANARSVCFRLFDAEILAADLDYIAADMYAAPGVVNVAPLYAAALAAPYPCCDDELEVSLVLDAFFLQRADQLMTRTSAS